MTWSPTRNLKRRIHRSRISFCVRVRVNGEWCVVLGCDFLTTCTNISNSTFTTTHKIRIADDILTHQPLNSAHSVMQIHHAMKIQIRVEHARQMFVAIGETLWTDPTCVVDVQSEKSVLANCDSHDVLCARIEMGTKAVHNDSNNLRRSGTS